MKVVDYDQSESGDQRRTAKNGELLHCCCVCGKLDIWGDSWSTYCSYKEMDDGVAIPKFCSDQCRAKAGPRASNISDDMKETARKAEWRPPNIVYRELTDIEKYRHALHRQTHKPLDI